MLFTLSVPAAEKTQYVVYLSFSCTLQSINGISIAQQLLHFLQFYLLQLQLYFWNYPENNFWN